MFFFFSSRRRHTRCSRDWSSDVCSSDLVETNLRKCFQLQVANTECDDFLHSGAGIEHGGEQRVIATSVGRGSIHASEHRLNLIVFEVLNGAGTGALERDGQHTLAMLDPQGGCGSAGSEKSVNGCQPDIS